jgi:uncharacterized membrane protein YoaT (DUF817 family)
MNHDIREWAMGSLKLRLFRKEIFHSERAYKMRVLLGSPVIFLVMLFILDLLKKFFGAWSSRGGKKSLCLLVMGLLFKRDTLFVMDVIMVSSMSVSIQFLFQNQRLGNKHPWSTDQGNDEEHDA